MEEAEIKARFKSFAAPLAEFIALGGRKEALEELARNLWAVMLAGEQAENEMWSSLAKTDSALCDTVKRCYFDEMKPLVSEDELAALRHRYWASED